MLNSNGFIRRFPVLGAGLLLVAATCGTGLAYERYSSCTDCHGSFTGSRSPKGTQFPGGDKHQMHRSGSNMDADCDLCHTDGDGRNAYIGSSNGTSNNPGLGCTGCHEGVGLRAHHQVNSIDCLGCHDAEVAPPESTKPRYYGTADTKVDNPCNDDPTANTGENWSVGDFEGLDNDGNNLYDLADFDCGPAYRLTDVAVEGADVRITWETVGGRTDLIQASADAAGPYTDVGSAISISGVGVVTKDSVVTGGAASTVRFYRIRSVP